jgi:hypothetical protein
MRAATGTRIGIAAVGFAIVAVAACAAPKPSVETRVLHLESRISQAVAVSVEDQDGNHDYVTALRPCGGRLDLTVGRELPAEGEWLIFLLIDPSGSLDAAVAAYSGDPHDLPGDYTGLPIWWSANIPSPDLPKWITVGESDAVLTDAPASSPMSMPCAARVFETSPP